MYIALSVRVRTIAYWLSLTEPVMYHLGALLFVTLNLHHIPSTNHLGFTHPFYLISIHRDLKEFVCTLSYNFKTA